MNPNILDFIKSKGIELDPIVEKLISISLTHRVLDFVAKKKLEGITRLTVKDITLHEALFLMGYAA